MTGVRRLESGPLPVVRSFAPVASRAARVLVLGSMPGVASLAAGRYYAHPRNAFWPIVAELCGFAADAPYARRLAALRARGIALWGRAAELRTHRQPRQRDHPGFGARQRLRGVLRRTLRIGAVLCNGSTAFGLFTRIVRPALPAPFASLPVARLPSTSPAHAGRSLAQKRSARRRELLAWLA